MATKKPALKDVPVIMLSGQNETHNIEQSFNSGAIDFVSKPIQFLELRARMQSILRLKKEMDQRKKREKGMTSGRGEKGYSVVNGQFQRANRFKEANEVYAVALEVCN